MIDFRYHLVSLVAVFLALAVGIVLGAGPLKDPIGATLTKSVQQLRNDQAALSQQLKTAQAGIDNRDKFVAGIEPALVADQLGGRSVVVVTLPGSDNDAVKPLTDAITAAGANVTGTIDVQNAWVDPADNAARKQAVEQLRQAVGAAPAPTPQTSPRPSSGQGSASTRASNPGSSPGSGSADGSGSSSAATDAAVVQTQAAQLLARAVLTTDVSASEKTDQTERTLLDGLSKAGLIDVTGSVPGRATQAVLLAPGVAQAVDGVIPTPTPTSSPATDVLSAWVTLARVLDSGSTGAVVAGPASSATTGGVLAAIRAQPQVSAGVSTVDTGGTPMGDVTTVFALREQQLGNAGNYGFSDGATAPLPSAATSGS